MLTKTDKIKAERPCRGGRKDRRRSEETRRRPPRTPPDQPPKKAWASAALRAAVGGRCAGRRLDGLARKAAAGSRPARMAPLRHQPGILSSFETRHLDDLRRMAYSLPPLPGPRGCARAIKQGTRHETDVHQPRAARDPCGGARILGLCPASPGSRRPWTIILVGLAVIALVQLLELVVRTPRRLAHQWHGAGDRHFPMSPSAMA